jgi:alanine-synthesizing transaminase
MSSNILPTSMLSNSEAVELEDLVGTTKDSGTAKGGGRVSVESVFGRDYLRSLKTLQHQMLVEGKQVFDLSMVNPDLTPPRAVLDRLLESVTKPQNHRYAVSRGVRRLREAFGAKYASRFGITLNPETEICVCLGSKDATYHAIKSLITVGDSVVVSSPSYPAHVSSVTLAGGSVVPWECGINPDEAAASLDRALAASRSRVVLLNFPSNPAGAVVSEEWWLAIADVCWRYGAAIINDFVYGEMCFSGQPAVSALTVRERGVRCVEVYSLSKAYNVPGWRVGALVGDTQTVQAVARWKSHSDYGLFLPLQYAASVALTAPQDLVRPTVMAYDRRLRVLAAGLRTLGWEVQDPQAGACLWAKYPADMMPTGDGSTSESVRVANELLRKTGVLVTPGVVFGDAWERYVRFSAVVTEERMREVVAALSRARGV